MYFSQGMLRRNFAVSVVMSNEIVCLVFAPTCTICSYYSVTMSISLIGVVPSLAVKTLRLPGSPKSELQER